MNLNFVATELVTILNQTNDLRDQIISLLDEIEGEIEDTIWDTEIDEAEIATA
jgi:hypothetical protein